MMQGSLSWIMINNFKNVFGTRHASKLFVLQGTHLWLNTQIY